MNEWGVVGVIVVLIGLVIAICKPLVKLNTSITVLTTKLDGIGGDLDKLTTDNTESHRRLWTHNEAQDKALADHDKRITILEHTDTKEGKKHE